MSIAKSETKALRSHLYKFHDFRDTTELSHGEMLRVHQFFHLDDWMTLPHSHPQGPDEFQGVEFADPDFESRSNYFNRIVKLARGEFE